jgi:hypothetical protein
VAKAGQIYELKEAPGPEWGTVKEAMQRLIRIAGNSFGAMAFDGRRNLPRRWRPFARRRAVTTVMASLRKILEERSIAWSSEDYNAVGFPPAV